MSALAICRAEAQGLMLPSSLRAIVFDVDGTLYDQRALRTAMLWKLLAHAVGTPTSAVRTLRVIREYRLCHEELRGLTETGIDLYGEQISRTAARSGVDAAAVRPIVRRWMEDGPLPLLRGHARSGLFDLVAQAREHGVRLGVFSDYPCRPKIAALGLDAYVDVVSCAQDPGVQRLKPDPRGLRTVLRALDVAPHEVIYVGDRPDVDAVAAARAGVSCVIIGHRRGRVADAPYVPVADFQELSSLLFPAP